MSNQAVDDQCLKFLAAMAVEYAQTFAPAVQETLLMRVQASHKHLVQSLTQPLRKVPADGEHTG